MSFGKFFTALIVVSLAFAAPVLAQQLTPQEQANMQKVMQAQKQYEAMGQNMTGQPQSFPGQVGVQPGSKAYQQEQAMQKNGMAVPPGSAPPAPPTTTQKTQQAQAAPAKSTPPPHK